MNISNSIRQYRLQNNLTQEELADTISVSRQTIIAIEKGNYTPSLLLAMQLAKYFKVTVEDLFSVKWYNVRYQYTNVFKWYE